MAEDRLDTPVIVPVVEEAIGVTKRVVETGRVSVSLTTETAQELIRETLRTRRAEVERVKLDQEVKEAPVVREEGDVLIIPVLEEVLVVEKRLVLREEIRLRFINDQEQVEQTVERRIQHAEVKRVPAGN